jgi:hypothetical protein
VQLPRLERNLVTRAVGEAEEFTARYYCIPPHRWQQLRYDLLTREDQGWQPIPDWALAHLQCLHWSHPDRNSGYDFYRIQLNDPSILSAAKRENLESDLYPFLVYILTHEMVHLVRHWTILPCHGNALKTQDEEIRVQRISHQILSDAEHLQLKPVLSKFSSIPSSAGSTLPPPQVRR